ncbi:MAG: SGNH/GDSL hydrolase family protein [Thermoleophilaceae bacterium]|nr:SGNH/GDSL hydrolase family protein [Thermoleophilaceae bacterium]
MTAPPVFSRYVALGDSTTEGLDDPYPGHPLGQEVFRGWADRLAERLAVDNPRIQYANLAIRGRLSGQIREEQLEPALAMNPDLASVVGGVNDVLRPKFDVDVVAGHLETMCSAFREKATTVLVMTLPDLSASMRVARIFSERLLAYNQSIRDIAKQTGATLVDMAVELSEYDPRGWSPDRLHANDLGHQYLMWGAADALGLPDAPEQLKALHAGTPETLAQARHKALAAESAWLWMHLRPWIVRRIKGTSSGDGISAKRPAMRPLLEQDLASSEA